MGIPSRLLIILTRSLACGKGGGFFPGTSLIFWDGHYRYSPGVEKLLGYYLLREDGSQTMLTPAEFEQRFGWKNDPAKVPHLPGMEEPEPTP